MTATGHKQLEMLVNRGIRIIKKFIKTTDFHQFKSSSKDEFHDVDYDNKEFILQCFLDGIPQFSRTRLTDKDFRIIGFTKSLEGYQVYNGYDSATYQSWPDDRPQLFLTRNTSVSDTAMNETMKEIAEAYPAAKDGLI